MSDIYDFLDDLEIAYEEVSHEPLMTVEDSKHLRGEIQGLHIRNMFLRDKKKNYWLLVAEEDQAVDLKALKRHLQVSGSLSFASSEALWEILQVKPGSVTPLAVMNDAEKQVQVLLDSQLFASENRINSHPLRNDRTIGIASEDLLKFLRHYHKEPKFIDFTSLQE